uniref:Uncharacterized protein n=1 Tax=Anthurium amnicola TaxID=1678845 RepID=A0A1D1Y0N3_9ARAE
MRMELGNPSNGGEQQPASEDACHGDAAHGFFPDDVDSSCSTPYVSAPSSPGRGGTGGYFFSAPASPMHFVLSSSAYTCGDGAPSAVPEGLVSGSFEFDFPARGAMISADELFLNGQIRPMNLSSHLQRPQVLAPLLDLETEGEEEEGDGDHDEPAVRGRDLKMRNRSLRRRARSMSPLRTPKFQWHDEEEEEGGGAGKGGDPDPEADPDSNQAAAATPSVSASSSRSSSTSSSRNSKRWVFLKDLLYRSKSEGRGNAKDKFWNAISFSPSKEKSSSFFFRDRFKESTKPPLATAAAPSSSSASAAAAAPTTSESQKPKQRTSHPSAAKKPSSSSSKPTNGIAKRRVSSRSPHERHYAANRAQAEEMRKKTFLPYRQGLLGCLWFSSRSYGAMNGFARTLNPVSSR